MVQVDRWNMEKLVIALSSWALCRRARSHLIVAATRNSIKSLYERTMVGPVSILKMKEHTDNNSHQLLTRVWHRVWHEFGNSNGSSSIGIN